MLNYLLDKDITRWRNHLPYIYRPRWLITQFRSVAMCHSYPKLTRSTVPPWILIFSIENSYGRSHQNLRIDNGKTNQFKRISLPSTLTARSIKSSNKFSSMLSLCIPSEREFFGKLRSCHLEWQRRIRVELGYKTLLDEKQPCPPRKIKRTFRFLSDAVIFTPSSKDGRVRETTLSDPLEKHTWRDNQSQASENLHCLYHKPVQ